MLTKNKLLSRVLAATLFIAAIPAHALLTDDGLWLAGGGTAFWLNRPDAHFIEMGGTNPPRADFYLPDGSRQVFAADVGIGYDFDWFWDYPVSYRAGLFYQGLFSDKINGKVRNADEIDIAYSYKFSTQAIFLDAQLDLFACQWLGPYIDAAIGVARNTFNDYGEITLPGQNPRVSPQFLNATQYNFAYRLGVGMNYSFKYYGNAFRISLAYMYSNYGTIESGNSNYYTNIAGQHIGHRMAGNQFEAMLRYYLE